MVFGVAMGRFQLRPMPKNGETSMLTTSFDSSDDDNDNDTSKVELMMLNTQSETFCQDGRRSAYDFDEFKAQVEEPKFTQSMGLLPIPLPCIEPSTTKDIDESSDKMNDDNSQDRSTLINFRWNSIRSQFSSAKAIDQENLVDECDRMPFFTCGSSSTSFPMMTDSQYNSMDGYDYSDDTSLLHGQTVHKASKIFKTSLITRPEYQSSKPSSSCTPTKKMSRLTKGGDEEQYESLIADQNDVCNDWLHRQLAFDLEYLENITISPNPVEYPFAHREGEPNWTLHPDDIALEVPPPPPPPPVRSKKSRKKGRTVSKGPTKSEEHFTKLVEGCDDPQILLGKRSNDDLSGNDSSAEDTFDLQEESWQNFDAEMRIGNGSSRYLKSYRKISPTVRSRFVLYNGLIREVHRRSHTSRQSRRRSGRRSPPILLGRQFATNLSTVTERPSEEEANSSCMPTPMSAKNRHFFSTYDSDTSSSQSEGGTAVTCSSKDSST